MNVFPFYVSIGQLACFLDALKAKGGKTDKVRFGGGGFLGFFDNILPIFFSNHTLV